LNVLKGPSGGDDHGKQMPKLSVLMPVYNEARTLRTIVGRVLAAPVVMEVEVVCVDDGSTDRSWEILQHLAAADPRIRVLHHPVNRGKGAALRTAISHMTGDVAVVQDSDLEYDPAELPRLIAPILDGKADAVFGSRFASSPERRVLFFWHSLGNKLLTMFCNMVNDLNLTDMETGYKAVRADMIRRLRLNSDRFGIEPEITTRLAQWGARIYEVPISYHGRSYAEGKSIGWRDGMQALWLIFKFRFLDTRFVESPSHLTRRSIGQTRAYRVWMLSRFADHMGHRLLEVMAGPGHVTPLLLSKERLVSIDSEPEFVETLRRRFGHLENVSFRTIDPQDPAAMVALVSERLDTALCLDGLHRTPDPKGFLAGVAEPLVDGGKVLIQVPADPGLFGPTDRAIGHLRRFTRQELESTIVAAGLGVVLIEDFNRLGRIGWRMHHMLGRDRVSTWEARLFGLMVPLARRIDNAGGRGLSLLAVARKP
jgi:glycosyltransferase involved in cell wall biosynthesis